MQLIDLTILKRAKKERMKTLEKNIEGTIITAKRGELVECPFCHYVGKNKRFTAKVFDKSFKCFACGIWRKI